MRHGVPCIALSVTAFSASSHTDCTFDKHHTLTRRLTAVFPLACLRAGAFMLSRGLTDALCKHQRLVIEQLRGGCRQWTWRESVGQGSGLWSYCVQRRAGKSAWIPRKRPPVRFIAHSARVRITTEYVCSIARRPVGHAACPHTLQVGPLDFGR